MTFTLPKTWLFAAVGLVLGFGAGYGVAALSRSARVPDEVNAAASRSAPEAPTTAPRNIDVDGQPAVGPPDAPVTVVEFTDYQCPFCARHHRETKDELLREYEGRIRYVVRNFPLRSIHPLAQEAAEAAECSADQGEFWDYADLLFERAPDFGRGALVGYAVELGMDRARFERCLDSREKAPAVEVDIRDGRRYGVRSTPTFFVNGRPVIGAKPLPEFRMILDEALGASDR